MDSRTFFLGNRVWWSVVLFVAPIAGALAADVLIGFLVGSVLILPVFLFFGTDRPWWAEGVRHLPEDPDGTKSEMLKFSLWSGAALVAGLAVAIVRPWAQSAPQRHWRRSPAPRGR